MFFNAVTRGFLTYIIDCPVLHIATVPLGESGDPTEIFCLKIRALVRGGPQPKSLPTLNAKQAM